MNEELFNWLSELYYENRPDEFETKKLLAMYNISCPRGTRVSPQDSLQEQLTFPSPYVAKVSHPEMAHKTEQHGVITGLDQGSLVEATDSLRTSFPDSMLLIEEQIDFQAMEFIVGAIHDSTLGPAVMVGAGGIYSELYDDVVFRLAPCGFQEAVRMISELKAAPIFSGFRGMRLDKGGLAETITAIGKLVVDLGDYFSQLDINPLVFTGENWVALDATLYLADN
ncbi:MAG: acetate--CoA ligase family protein [Desulfohalobiaceae bacterium]|nr:acetate--CoA ligase family protein [Desulfohalobiaceae bacterium]